MIFCGIAAHDQDTVTVLNINPVIGHCTASERLSQSRNRGRVSDPGLMIELHQAE